MVRYDVGVTAKETYRRSLDRSTMQESSDEGRVPMGQNESLVVDRAYETWNSGDVSGLKELYAADADVAIPGATVRGRDQVGALSGARLYRRFPMANSPNFLGSTVGRTSSPKTTSAVPIRHRWLHRKVRYQLPETMSPLTAFRSSRLKMARSSPSTFISTK